MIMRRFFWQHFFFFFTTLVVLLWRVDEFRYLGIYVLIIKKIKNNNNNDTQVYKYNSWLLIYKKRIIGRYPSVLRWLFI